MALASEKESVGPLTELGQTNVLFSVDRIRLRVQLRVGPAGVRIIPTSSRIAPAPEDADVKTCAELVARGLELPLILARLAKGIIHIPFTELGEEPFVSMESLFAGGFLDPEVRALVNSGASPFNPYPSRTRFVEESRASDLLRNWQAQLSGLAVRLARAAQNAKVGRLVSRPMTDIRHRPIPFQLKSELNTKARLHIISGLLCLLFPYLLYFHGRPGGFQFGF